MFSLGQTSLLDLLSSFLGDDSNERSPPAAPPSASSESWSPTESSDLGDAFITQDCDPHVKVVIFSKDRPWQLQQLFRSMHLDEGRSNDDADMTISLELMVHITEHYEAPYEQVIASLDSTLEPLSYITLTCHREDPACSSSFQSLMEKIIMDDEDEPSHWMFITDDCILLISLRELLQTATSAFYTNQQVKCFLSRLHPGICWTQTRSIPSPPPRSFLRYLPGRSSHGDGVYVYPLERGELDWAYPWDLSGGIYAHSFVKTIFEDVRGTDGLSHPNRMEIAGNQAIAPFLNKNFLASVPTCPMMLILAINRVQNVCQAPLACDDADVCTLDPESLLSFYYERKKLDIAQYKSLHFNSSHIGDLHLLDDESELANDVAETAAFETENAALSVLIPVHCGPSQAAKHAIQSIVMQPIEEYQDYLDRRIEERNTNHDVRTLQLCLSPMQIVLVDDRCTDGSISAMMESVQAIASEYSFLYLAVQDYRQGGESNPVLGSPRDGIKLSVDIIPSPRPGVAVALNHGLSYCQSDLIARMDADDIASPGRLLAQVATLRFQTKLNVVGTSALLFREEAAAADNDEPQKSNSTRLTTDKLPYSSVLPAAHDSAINVMTSLPPTDAGFAAWAMLFSCSIAHPSIMYRKNTIVEAGGYNESYYFSEDYELWLRLTTQNCSSLASIPKIGLWHRKHRAASQRTSQQSEEALCASVDVMKGLLASTDSKWSTGSRLGLAASVLRKPDTAISLDQVNDAADLLHEVETAFLQHHDEALTVREKLLIKKDCDERIGELATLTLQRSLVAPRDVDSSLAWKLWRERCPELSMTQVALLCHSYHDV